MGEKVQLGSRVKDSITGIIGIVTARTEYLHGTPCVCVEFTNGEPVMWWVAESRVEVVT